MRCHPWRSICTSHLSAPDDAERCCLPGCWCEQAWPYFLSCMMFSTCCQCHSRFSSRLWLLHSTVSMALVQPTSKTSVPQLSTPQSSKPPFGPSRWYVQLFVPQTRTHLSRQSFHVAALTAWNSFPLHLRSPSVSRWQLRAGLKCISSTKPTLATENDLS